jgi:hypothetical protein
VSVVLDPLYVASQARRMWQTQSTVPMEVADCTVALVPTVASAGSGQFCFVGLGTQLEDLDWSSITAFDLARERPSTVAVDELLARFAQGQIGVVVKGARPSAEPATLPPTFVTGREALRQQQVYARFLIMQIALDEMTSQRGAGSDLVDELVGTWSVPLAISMDLSVLFTLGADRQRYVSDDYEDIVILRRKALLRHLASRGVSSNPLLAV